MDVYKVFRLGRGVPFNFVIINSILSLPAGLITYCYRKQRFQVSLDDLYYDK